MANLKEAFEYASQNPDSDFARNLEQLASTGSLNKEAQKYGIDLSPFQQKKTLVDQLGERAKTFGKEALNVATLGATSVSPQDVKEARNGQGELVALQAVNRAAQSPIRMVGAVGGAIGDVIGAGMEAVGLDKAIGSAVAPVVQSDPIQKAMQVFQSLPQDTQEVLGSIMNTANIPLGGVGVSAAKSGLEAGAKIAGKAGAQAVKSIAPDASSIMQRVARIPKQKQIKFQNTAGESVGEYLTKRGIYGDEEQIVEQLYKRFSDSKKVADDALEQLPGTYQPQQVKDALEMLQDKFTKSSTKGVKDPNLSRVEGLIAKYDTEGLTMPEVNESKRLFERNAKLDFARENNPDGIRLANNVDNSIREWQFTKADELGLKNLPDINKETRLARQLMDDLGAESAGIAGNNAVSLTDWIVLAEGNPASIAAFLGKKAAASKKLQSAVAKRVAGKPTVGQPEAMFTNAKKTTSLPEQKLLQQSLPESTPSTVKSKGIRGMIDFGELGRAFTPSEKNIVKSGLQDLKLAKSENGRMEMLKDVKDLLVKEKILSKASANNSDIIEEAALRSLEDSDLVLSAVKNKEMSTPMVKKVNDRFIKNPTTGKLEGSTRSIPSKVYHGTPSDFKGEPNFPLYLTSDKKYADIYQNPSASSLSSGKKATSPTTKEFTVNPNAKVLDSRTPEGKALLKDYWDNYSVSGMQVKTKSGLPDWTEGTNLEEFLQEKGYKFDALLLDEGGVPSNNGTKSRGVSFVALNKNAFKAK